jgi:hypothetical protein
VRRIFVLGVLFAACEDAEPEPTWAERDFDERFRYMNDVVLPTMKDIFEAYDPERFAGFTCTNCHGPDAAAQDYAMPAFLPALPLEGTLEAAQARDPETTAFMLDEVFPTIVLLLDEEKFDHETAPDGFRCTRCHLVEE